MFKEYSMKNFVKVLGIIALVAVIGFSMTACNTGNSPGGGGSGKTSSGSGKTSTGADLIVMDTAMLNSNLESISNGTLVFNNLEAKDMPVKGDIICSEPTAAAPYGFLYKVKTVTTSGGRTVITTEMATIEEAVEEAEVEQTFDLVFAVDEQEEIDGVEVELIYENENSMQRGTFKPFSTIKLNIDKTVKGVNLKGSLELSTTVDISIKIGNFWEKYKLKYFEFSTNPQFKADLAASIGGKIEKEIKFPIVEKLKFAKITVLVGVVPVVFTPEISIDCVITTEGEVLLSATKLADWDYSFVFGIQSTNGSKLDAFQRNTSKPAKYLEGLQFDLNGKVKLEPRVGFMVGLYDMAYAGMSGGFYAMLAGESGIYIGANTNANAKLSLSCGLEFGADAKLTILSYKIGEYHKTFYTQKWLIWEKTWTTTTAVTGVALNKSYVSLVVGGTETLTPTITPANATNKTVSWRSSNNSIATVSAQGIVAGVAAGTATITVTTVDGNKTADCTVTVTVPVIGVSLNKSSTSIVVGNTETLSPTITPANATNKTVSWRSSNASIATVSSNGTVTAVAPGSATITITTADGNKTATCTVTILQTVSPDRIEYYWVDQHDNLVTTSGGATTISSGSTLVITAQDSGYSVKNWYLNGVNTGQSENTYNFSSMTAGKHTVSVVVEKSGKPYNTNITITVQ